MEHDLIGLNYILLLAFIFQDCFCTVTCTSSIGTPHPFYYDIASDLRLLSPYLGTLFKMEDLNKEMNLKTC